MLGTFVDTHIFLSKIWWFKKFPLYLQHKPKPIRIMKTYKTVREALNIQEKEPQCWKMLKRPLNKKVESNGYKHTTKYWLRGEWLEKPKKTYMTLKDAFLATCKINTNIKTIHEVVPYKCKTCGFFHVGRTLYVLEDHHKEYIREKIKNPMEVEKILTTINQRIK